MSGTVLLRHEPSPSLRPRRESYQARDEDSKNGLRFALRRPDAEIIDILHFGQLLRLCLVPIASPI